MRLVNAAWVVCAMLFSASAMAEVKTSLELSAGSSEFSFGSLSDTGGRYRIGVQAQWDHGLTLGLDHENRNYSDLDAEVDETTLDIGWALAANEALAFNFGLSGVRARAEVGTTKSSDNAYGGFVGVDGALSDAVTAGLKLTYLEEDEGNEDLFEIAARVDMSLTDTASIGLEYWTRTESSSGTPDLDEESISVILGLHF